MLRFYPLLFLLFQLSLLFPKSQPCLVTRFAEHFDQSPIQMNGCQCPQIYWIGSAGIAANPLSAHLSHRPTFYPANVTVSSDCKVTIDAPESCEYDNYYFMMFRSNGAPIFNRRFLPEYTKDAFSPVGLTCEDYGDEFVWEFYGGRLEQLSFALQSNEEMCGCWAWETRDASVDTLYNMCDIFELKCPSHLEYALYASIAFAVLRKPGVLDDLTCVENNWYLNNIRLYGYLQLRCSNISIYEFSDVPISFSCGCASFVNINNDVEPTGLLDATGKYRNYTLRSVEAVYSDENEFCAPRFGCTDTETLVIFGMGREPKEYKHGSSPYGLTCRPSPLSSSPNSSSFWFLEGEILPYAAFGCYNISGF